MRLNFIWDGDVPLSQMKIRQACDFYAHSVMTAVSSLKSRSLESEDKKAYPGNSEYSTLDLEANLPSTCYQPEFLAFLNQ